MAGGLLLFGSMVVALLGQEARVVETEHRVMVTKGSGSPVPAVKEMGLAARDRLGTGDDSRAVLRMSAKWLARVDEQTDIQITPGALGARSADDLKVALGGVFIYSREEEGELRVTTPTATGGLRGTQLAVRVWPDGRTQMQVLEGEVEMANQFGQVLLASGEAGEAEVGQAPRKTAVIETRNLLQWALYYPAVLLPEELGLTSDEQRDLALSLDAYRQGDVLAALDHYPAGSTPASPSVRLYRAAVFLATGQVDAARTLLAAVPADHPGRLALERMLAAVLFVELPEAGPATTAGAALADSYYQQSRGNLAAARSAAKRATELAPYAGFAFVRLAELEFSFGRTREAKAALEKGLKLGPRNAQGHALRGYLLSAENRIAVARESFLAAVQLDGGLGSAWLGLGLTKIKQGRLAEGRADLQVAAAVEATRAFFYSYHGKALSREGSGRLAAKDLALAKQLDPKDPTPWLYSALLAQQENRPNLAIDEMQESIRLNDNRRVYRSRFLLDQDSAVRGANLAKIYQHDSMPDLSVREATRAVDSDYASSSAHLFLANSYDALRDPKRLALRYETAWFNELLLANLLAPVGGGPLSQFVSQQEYSKLLEADGVGGNFTTEFRDGGYLDQQASLYLTRGRLSTGLDFAYHSDDGIHPNSDSVRRELYWQLKYQVSAYDSLYGLVKWQDQENGDVNRSYDNLPGNPGLRYTDKQEPGLLLLGWNHQWAPNIHTLLLGGRLATRETLDAPDTRQLMIERDPAALQPGFLRPKAGGGLEYTSDVLRNATTPAVSTNPDGSLNLSADFQRTLAPFLGQGAVTGVFSDQFDFSTRREFQTWSAEIQHLWQARRHTLLLGGRWQEGDFETASRLDALNSGLAVLFTAPAALQQEATEFGRRSYYVYDFCRVAPWLTVIAGASWDWLNHPDNFRNPPVNDRQVETERANAKLGFTVSPSRWVTLRGVYTEALGGVSFDESVRLEPVQFAGFNQAFRTVISESIAGSIEAPVYRNIGVSLEGLLPGRTWWSAAHNRLTEDVRRTVGAFDILYAPVFPNGVAILPSSSPEKLAYREETVTVGINHLIGDEFAVGAGYRRNRARLHYRAPQIPSALAATSDRVDVATLQELKVTANWNSPKGWYARAEANWYVQELAATLGGLPTASPPGDDFWQYNLQLGFRFHRNQREVGVGLLNLNDRDYRLSPLNDTAELPHSRTVIVRCRLGF